ncbi:hypothetical protein IX39_04715 [Chryseobacterium formosense]|uniref:DUF6705 domain-containing protein n=2 Tax=Chryseobacterium formosense TaxID=236814 RepID=A0A085Z690_9FLAO|nr:hypothetical protein IX39_04715 [Chryseobacterium formosense]SFT60481.1 hypothetical protein SAMN05421857_2026 [Chryseobacterium formosense]
MKKIFLLSTIIFLSVQCKAQSHIVNSTDCDSYFDRSSGDYYRKDLNNIMDNYVGTWKWTSGNKEFLLTLIKQVKHHYHEIGNNDYYRDRLVGYYIYKENGIIIADTSSDNNLSSDYGMKVMFILNCHSQIASIAFEDYKKYKSFEVILESLSSTQIKMNMYEREHSIIIYKKTGVQVPAEMPQGGSTFPMEMILTKQ